jgi:hypothetical protein
LAWLESLGIKYSPSRVGKYKDIISARAEHQLAGTLDAFNKEYKFERWGNAAHEVGEVLLIFEGLTRSCDQNLQLRLCDA